MNLVQLLGYCIHGEERILIYEYMHNKSLDFYLFGKEYFKVDLIRWCFRRQKNLFYYYVTTKDFVLENCVYGWYIDLCLLLWRE